MKLLRSTLSIMLLTLVVSIGAPVARAAMVTVNTEATEARLSHAKELLGKYYKRSVVKSGENYAEINTQLNNWTSRAMKASSGKVSRAVASAILHESKRYELDPVFVAAVIQSESSFNPLARGDAGEIGMMQILPGTAEWIAKKYQLPWKGNKTLLDPVMNIRIGTAYIDFLRSRFDSHSRLYLSAYNMGPKNVDRARLKHIWPRDYASRVMKNYVGFYTEIAGVAKRL